MLAVFIAADVSGMLLATLPKSRRSWLFINVWIKVPALINRSALKVAWVIKWKNAIVGALKEILIIIIPSWLNVESAIIFFMSVSNRAAVPAIRVVSVEIIINSFMTNKLDDIKG